MESLAQGPEQASPLRDHGGNINAARRLYPDVAEPWIDLSTGINPVPYPVPALRPDAWTRLPEPAALAALEGAARFAYGVSRPSEVVAAPGTQALIQWLPRIFPARRVGVLGLTYGGHETTWRATGADVTTVTALPELTGFDVAVVVNPNNPDGGTVAPAALAAVAGGLPRHGRLIVDEAFMDVLDRQHSLIPHLPEAGVIVLRSFGKAYGLGGLRLGFAITSGEDGAVLRQALGPWAVSGPAIETGRRALMDGPWLADTVYRLRDQTSRLDQLLSSAGFSVLGGTPLFRLAEHRQATDWFDRLCRRGILTRPFESRPSWIRFGIPGAEAEWQRLQAVLRP